MKEDVCMNSFQITRSEKVWEVLYASVMLEGEQREAVLRELLGETPPAA
jgi:hypothetical protein